MLFDEKLRFTELQHRFDEKIVNIITGISILYVFLLIVELYITPSAKTASWLIIIDTAICFIFLIEFFYFLFKAKNKAKYAGHNFIDLLSSMPLLLLIAVTPYAHLFNIFKLLRGFKSIIKIYEYVVKKSMSVFAKLVFFFLIAVIFFAIVIVTVERDYNQKIVQFHDGLWLALSTISTVGYGDVIPITPVGKLIASVLMIVGIGLTSAIGAMLMSWALKPGQKRMYEEEVKIEQQEAFIEKQEKTIEHNEKEISNATQDIAGKESLILKKLDRMEKEIQDIKKPRKKTKKNVQKRKKR
ncbi:hypothetical protein C4573_02040 [Candidatus Woesearchaeota archaeon]|nr:MAG: hypothetical protein C4573_02040 [Candidatus Woesearchaeota archaeon]